MIDKFRILSIDGGGIKGLYTATLLAKFENEFGPLYQYFDLISGTSTGGIIALALAAGIPAAQVVLLYEKYGPLIFPYKSRPVRAIQFLKQLSLRSKYGDSELKRRLSDVFGELKIRDCRTTVLIPTVNITDGTPYVFKSDHASPLTRDSDRLLAEVALATAAAPTYFPIAEVTGCTEQFVDGGLWANNPSLVGLQEALDYYVGRTHKSIALLSVATLHEYTKIPYVKRRRRSMYKWGSKLFGLMIDTQSLAVENHIKLLLRSNIVDWDYLRISGKLNQFQKGLIELDMASPSALSLLKKQGEASAAEWIENIQLKRFFS